MLGNVFLKTLRDLREQVLAWSLGLVILGGANVLLYPTIQNMPGLVSFMENMPAAFKAMVGDLRVMVTPEGFMRLKLFDPPHDDRLFKLEARNAIGHQPARAVIAVIDGYLNPGLPQPLCRRQTAGARADHDGLPRVVQSQNPDELGPERLDGVTASPHAEAAEHRQVFANLGPGDPGGLRQALRGGRFLPLSLHLPQDSRVEGQSTDRGFRDLPRT